jgi:paraquat-inducible protein B
MAENHNGQDLQHIPEATSRKPSRSISMVWLIPLIAAIIGGWIAVKTQLDRGPTITITFKTAEGIEAGKTRIKYNDVNIGEVKKVNLSDDNSHVIVTAELLKESKKLLVDDTRFWVVRARVAGGQVSGLSTLLSGSYIGVDIGKSVKPRHHFKGLEVQPIVTGGYQGRQFILHAEELGSLDIGAPVFFRRIQVGSVTAYTLDKTGKGVTIKIYVHAPYEQYVTNSTRFWNASGVDVDLNAEGLKVRTEGLAALVIGGIAFKAPPHATEGLKQAEVDSSFILHPTYAEAMKKPNYEVVHLISYFNQSVRGLSPGAPLQFLGVTVGEVKAVDLELDAKQKDFRAAVDMEFYPERFWARVRSGSRPANMKEAQALWSALAARGLRAQLKTGSLVTGQAYVALDFFPDAKKVATIDISKQPVELPTVPGTIEDLQASLVKIMKKLDSLPLEQIGNDLRQALISLDKTLKTTNGAIENIDRKVTPELVTTLESATKALATADKALAAGSPLQEDARETMREVSRAAAAVRGLADYLERHPESLIRGKQEETQK